jgi:hypothetical protein
MTIDEIRFLLKIAPKRYPELEEEIFKDTDLAVEYASILFDKSVDQEYYAGIVTKENLSYSLYRYAVHILQGPWPEAEPIILTCEPKYALYYVQQVLKNQRSPVAEAIIMTSPTYAFAYASGVMKTRWLEAEPVIMQDAKYAYYYARYVLKARWPEAELYIQLAPQWALAYASDIIQGRWPEAEQYILTGKSEEDDVEGNPYIAYCYAADIIKGRWKEAEHIIQQSKTYWNKYKENQENPDYPVPSPMSRRAPNR